MNAPYRAAVVGLGRIGCELHSPERPSAALSHVAAFRQHSRTSLVGICDSSERQRTACLMRYPGVPAYSSLERMLEETRPEILSICTPTATHCAVAEQALQSREIKALFLEKPLAPDIESAERLVRSADNRGTLLAVNHTRRYVDDFEQLLEEIENGRIGRVLNVTGTYTRGVINNGCHWFDLATFLAGPVSDVAAFGVTTTTEDPTPDVRVSFQSGARGYLSGLEEASYGVFDMQLDGTSGRIEVRRSGREIRTYKAQPSVDARGFMALMLVEKRQVDLDKALPSAVTDLVAALDNGSEPRCGGASALAALRLSCAVVQSLRSGERVRLPATALATL